MIMEVKTIEKNMNRQRDQIWVHNKDVTIDCIAGIACTCIAHITRTCFALITCIACITHVNLNSLIKTRLGTQLMTMIEKDLVRKSKQYLEHKARFGIDTK